MNDLKKNIIEELKKINYPEFNRDIISFGILKDLVIGVYTTRAAAQI